jgi:hypothetical protein
LGHVASIPVGRFTFYLARKDSLTGVSQVEPGFRAGTLKNRQPDWGIAPLAILFVGEFCNTAARLITCEEVRLSYEIAL